MRERTIVLHSLSKSHALAGCRIGFVTAPAAVIASARRVSTHTAFNVSVAMQRAALAALEDGAFPRAARDAYREARDVTARALDGSGVRFHLAEGATYLFLEFAPVFAELDPASRGERPLLALLERAVDRGVLLAPGDAFGAWPTHARLCYTAVPLDRLSEGVARLLDAVSAMRRGAP
jgi:aspartate/methionine/tyrosine aminotransferase